MSVRTSRTTTVGAFEAKTKLSSLLDLVERGEEVIITRNGRAVARLAPLDADKGRDARAAAIRRLSELSQKLTLGGISWKELRDAGRKY
jgi:prevent-host-death family protein